MDPATTALLISTLAGIWTAVQEFRHRKMVKAVKAGKSMADALGATKVTK
jgi:hypothetical protein